MRWSRARHPRMTRNRSGHSRRLRVGDGMRSPSVWHFVKRFAPCRSGALSGQNRHRTVPSTFIPLRRTSQCNQHPGCATLYLDCSAASEDLFDTARRRLESAIGTLSVLDLLDETEDRRKHLPHHRLLAVVAQRRPVAVRGGIRTQTTITDGGGAPRRGRGLEESLCEPVCSLSRIHTGLNYERLCRTIRLVWLGCCGELGMPFRYMPNDLK